MKRALVVLFVATISLPLALNLAGVDGADPGAENRELAAFPHVDASLSSVAALPAAFSRWFDDHFGFRSLLVRWYGESRLFGLGVSPSAAVVNGADGWFFYGDDKAVEDFANAEPMTDEALSNWRAAIVRARDWLRARGIAYVFTIAPDKHVIYADEMPPTIVRLGDLSRTDQLFTALQDTGLAVDVRGVELEAKSRERVYQKTDTHWNERGAFVAYQRIIQAVRARVPATPPAWRREDFVRADRTIEGLDLAGMMGLTRVLRETDLTLVPTRARRARVVDPAGAGATDELGRIVTEIDDPSLPRAVIFRDSFTSQLVPFLSEHFSRAVYLWQNDFDANAVTEERPDVVIQEIVGRHLYNFIPSPELVPKP
ncbi:MAG: alginate O-acetyltransferase [Acidobacteria bacterium]|nr:alginate O-acetyltransferase [Acidobacteriota bacterium]